MGVKLHPKPETFDIDVELLPKQESFDKNVELHTLSSMNQQEHKPCFGQ